MHLLTMLAHTAFNALSHIQGEDQRERERQGELDTDDTGTHSLQHSQYLFFHIKCIFWHNVPLCRDTQFVKMSTISFKLVNDWKELWSEKTSCEEISV